MQTLLRARSGAAHIAAHSKTFDTEERSKRSSVTFAGLIAKYVSRLGIQSVSRFIDAFQVATICFSTRLLAEIPAEYTFDDS